MDKVAKIGLSQIQHGTDSRRVYLMQLHPEDFPAIINTLKNLASENKYTKIFVKIPTRFGPEFIAAGYRMEAMVPRFFNGREDAFFMGLYLDPKREKINTQQMLDFQHLIIKAKPASPLPLNQHFSTRCLAYDDIESMIRLFKQVFETYPFPIFDASFIRNTMSGNTRYFGLFDHDKLVAISSAECNNREKNVEMTDFAVLPDHRGKNIASHLLRAMECHLANKNFKTFYTIARLRSIPMNKTFLNNHYQFAGILSNNTQIAGSIESMTVWYKNL